MAWYDLVNIGLLVVIWTFISIHFNGMRKDRPFWLLFFITYTVTEIISVPLKLYAQNNLLLYNISKPIQFLLLLNYLSMALALDKTKTYLWNIAGALICIALFATGDMTSYKSLQEVLLGAIISILCVAYFYNIIRADKPFELNASEFWYCSALFIYFGTSLAINGSLDYLIKHHLAIAQKLFYGLVFSSYFLYALNLYAIISNYQLKKHNG